MIRSAIELDLPLGDPKAEAEARDDRVEHLTTIPGIDAATAGRLVRTFPTLAAVYTAPEERLSAAVGPVAAARLRWFLDAPLSAAALPGRRRRHWNHAA